MSTENANKLIRKYIPKEADFNNSQTVKLSIFKRNLTEDLAKN